jgi:hypothetical protein
MTSSSKFTNLSPQLSLQLRAFSAASSWSRAKTGYDGHKHLIENFSRRPIQEDIRSRRTATVASPRKNRYQILIPIPNRWSRRRIRRRNRIVIPFQSGIIRIVRSWKRNERTWLSTPSTSNLNLRTRQIHLSATNILRLVQRDRLDAYNVLTRRRIPRNRERHRGFL